MRIGLIFALMGALIGPAWGQGAVLQGGAPVAGHVPQYIASGNSQAIVIDGGGAGGGSIGVNPSEIGITARGTGTAPYASQGTGILGTNFCDYDAPTNNATGYHYFCLSPNAQGGGLLAYGAVGTASVLPLSFYVNGTTYAFPFTVGGIVGPGTTVVNDAACWNNLVGTLLKDCGAFVTVGGNNTWTGTNNFTGTFQIGGVTQTFPASGNIIGNSDTQTLTNKSIGASQINSGTLSATVFPALTGDVTNSAGALATTISAGVVTNAKLAVAGAQNTIKGAATSTTIADLPIPSCSGASNALQWVTNTGYQCGTLSVQTAGWGLALNTGVLSIATAQPPYGFDQPVNLGLSAAAAGSNLTITLTGANGSNASATNPVSIPFRSGTLTTGTPLWGIITSALTLVIPSGATLGTSSANVPFRIWLFASYNGGTPQMGAAVCSISTQIYPCVSWEYNRITSTTISGLATSAGTLYATAGVSNDPVRIIGYCDYASGLATAGSWASSCTTLQLFGPGVKKPGDVVQKISFTTSTPTTGAGTGFVASAAAIAITPTSAPNLMSVRATGGASIAATVTFILQLSRGTTQIGSQAIGPTVANTGSSIALEALDAPGVVTSTTYAVYGKCSTTADCTFPVNGNSTTCTSGPCGGITVEEIMGALKPDNDNEPLSMVG